MRRGVSLPEVVVVAAILSLLLLVMIFALPRRREVARTSTCRRNLMQIGVALALYDRTQGSLPVVPSLEVDPTPTGGPLRAILDALVLPDLNELSDATNSPAPRPGQVPRQQPVSGFHCPSDPFASGPLVFPAPISYRATTGDRSDGLGGGFTAGKKVTLSEIENGDGLGFTAAFSERLLGTRTQDQPAVVNYRLVSGRIGDEGCPITLPSASWKGDAGWSWAEGSWRSTLYNHSLVPGATASCVASDGQTAQMGASSGHMSGINVLIFDGSVRSVVPTIDLKIWKALATIRSEPLSGVPLR